MPRAAAKSGPSGITMTKSSTLMNCTAETKKTTVPSLFGLDFVKSARGYCLFQRHDSDFPRSGQPSLGSRPEKVLRAPSLATTRELLPRLDLPHILTTHG